MKKYVNRYIYTNFLRRHRDKPIIKVISGVRRSGKSVLLEMYRDDLISSGVSPECILSINFEMIEFENLLDYRKLHDYIIGGLVPDKKYYIFLDEIQNVPQFEKAVDSLYVRNNVDLYITGSNAYFMSGELATLLSGRYVELQILPLSFSEYVTWHKDNQISHTVAPHTLDEYYTNYIKSSFPYTLSITNDDERFDYLQGIYSTVVLKDIVNRLGVKDVGALERILKAMMSSIGSETNVSKIRNTCESMGVKVTNQTVARWMDGIFDSLLMYSVPNYNIKGRNLLSTNQKIYSVDPGLRRLMLRDHISDRGHVLENVIFLELLRRGNKVYRGKIGESEVDFVAISSGNEVEYLQVAWETYAESTLKRELRSLNAVPDNYPKTLLTMDSINSEANYDGIKKSHALRWLLGND